MAKQPMGDKTLTEHIHAMRLEFGTKQHIFEDSLEPHITTFIAGEHIDDIDGNVDRVTELYILYSLRAYCSNQIASMEHMLK